MPAATPSQPRLENVLKALIACGIRPGAIHVEADGAFRVEAVDMTGSHPNPIANTTASTEDEAPSWEEIQ